MSDRSEAAVVSQHARGSGERSWSANREDGEGVVAVLSGGLKGAVARTKHGDARTGTRERKRPSENRSESRESSRLGLWWCSSTGQHQLLINEWPGIFQVFAVGSSATEAR
ncbi:hypothetical protein [Halorubrum sp. PV6]|uniref:hypothetical protein n=1 Tax=Halorubrum sp. PV6 TaxID=634157 RepID=UPI000F8D9AF6|nr:hypothetical protein [Halorubrum sp. PV6]